MSGNLRQLIPSPAMIVALVALVMSLGGSAYATLMNGESSPPIPGESIQNNSVTGNEIKNNSVTGKEIQNNSLRGRDLHKNSVRGRAIRERSLGTVPSASSAGGLDMWAVVNSGGGIVRKSGVLSGGRMTTGIYQVKFERDVRNCSYQATIGNPGPVISDQDSQITVSALPSTFNNVPIPNNINGVLVRTADRTNVPSDRAFQLAVSC
jgi:hypothetical protein